MVPVLHHKTRWSRKLYMMERFLRIRDNLAAVVEDDNSLYSAVQEQGDMVLCIHETDQLHY